MLAEFDEELPSLCNLDIHPTNNTYEDTIEFLTKIDDGKKHENVKISLDLTEENYEYSYNFHVGSEWFLHD